MVNQKYKKKGFLGTRDKTRKVPMLKANIYIDVSKHLGEYLKQEEIAENISILMDTVGEEEILSFPESDEQTYGKVYFQEIQEVLASLQGEPVDPKVFLRDYRSTFREDAKSFEKRIDKVVAVLTGKEEEPEQETEDSERAISNELLATIKGTKISSISKKLLEEPSIFITDTLGTIKPAGVNLENITDDYKEIYEKFLEIFPGPKQAEASIKHYNFILAASKNKLTKKLVYELISLMPKGGVTGDDIFDEDENVDESVVKQFVIDVIKSTEELSIEKTKTISKKSTNYRDFSNKAKPLFQFFQMGVPLFKEQPGDIGEASTFEIHEVYADNKDIRGFFEDEPRKEAATVLLSGDNERIKQHFEDMEKDKLGILLSNITTLTQLRNDEMLYDLERLEKKIRTLRSNNFKAKLERKIRKFKTLHDEFANQNPLTYAKQKENYKSFLNLFKELYDDVRKIDKIGDEPFVKRDRDGEDETVRLESRIRELIKPYLKQKLKNKRRIS